MADWTPIGNGELVADQPITESLLTRLRDNPIAIIERAAGAPTYGWTVTSTGSNANGFFRIWDDGYIEQWAYVSTIQLVETINFPVAFTDPVNIHINVNGTYPTGNNGGAANADVIRSISEGFATIGHYTTSGLDGFIWFAGGY